MPFIWHSQAIPNGKMPLKYMVAESCAGLSSSQLILSKGGQSTDHRLAISHS